MVRFPTVFICAAFVLFNVEFIHSRGRVGRGNHTYPNTANGYPQNAICGVGTRHNYTYNPPEKILYASPQGGPAMSYPVYRANLPSYVYQYKESGSKYGTLLAGLALFNFGALYSGAKRNRYDHYYPLSDETSLDICLFGVKQENGDYEEAKIACHSMSSFNFQNAASTNTDGFYTMSPNGTVIRLGSVSFNAENATSEAPVTDSATSSVITNPEPMVYALDIKGPAIQVTAAMQCYVIRVTSGARTKFEVPCGLLQTYADQSLKPRNL